MDPEVTLITNPSDNATTGVLDLTGENKGPVVDLTGGATETTEVKPDVTDETGGDGKKPDGEVEGDGGEGKDKPGDKEGEETSDEEPAFFFGDQAVEVSVPAEISAQLAEAGVDEKALLGELFAKDGKFELGKETREKLEAKFGKVMVDGYLQMYRGLNTQVLAEHANTTKAAEAQATAMKAEYSELVGGEEGLNKLEAYVLANFDDKQIASYNAVMAGESWEAQKMVLQMARQQMAQADKLANGDRTVKLLGDGDPNTSAPAGDLSHKTSLTSAEYQKIMDSDKYWTDRDYQRQVDSIRSASIRAGR